MKQSKIIVQRVTGITICFCRNLIGKIAVIVIPGMILHGHVEAEKRLICRFVALDQLFIIGLIGYKTVNVFRVLKIVHE